MYVLQVVQSMVCEFLATNRFQYTHKTIIDSFICNMDDEVGSEELGNIS